MASPRSPRLVDSFTAPKEVLQEFAEMAEEEDIDPFAETASKRQIAARQSDYHNRRFNRQAHESTDVFKAVAEGQDVEGGYKEAMKLQRLEKEEERVRRAIEEKERQAREEGQGRSLAGVGSPNPSALFDISLSRSHISPLAPRPRPASQYNAPCTPIETGFSDKLALPFFGGSPTVTSQCHPHWIHFGPRSVRNVVTH
ncbi:hypothetical protein ONZ51_g7622 [Trametes cubensis]|uniref:Uncharacterized protein n=1 Tax=Trametes cubensis TaxID=1111947 RepID=A0AAD7TQ52_9APHY|nr:hypothetical protein ONZ51_g7622 [Trametes cubensis]